MTILRYIQLHVNVQLDLFAILEISELIHTAPRTSVDVQNYFIIKLPIYLLNVHQYFPLNCFLIHHSIYFITSSYPSFISETGIIKIMFTSKNACGY